MKQGWKIKRLEEICLQITDGSHYSPKDDPNGKYPMLSVKDMSMNGFVYDSCKYVNEVDYQVLMANGCKPSINDVLVAKDGSYLKTAFVQKEDKKEVLLSSIAILSPNTDILHPEYLAYFFRSQHTRDVVERYYLTGTAIKRVILKGFRKIQILVPSREEQERIVAELDCLSGVIEKKKQQLKELDALAQSIFYQMFGDPITNEKGWEVKKLGEVGKVITGNTPSTKDEENYSSNDYCFVKPSDIGKDYVTNIEKTEFYISDKAFSKSRKLCKGSVLTTCIGIIGKVGILKVDATCNQQINAILPNDNYISGYVAWAIYLTRSVIEDIANAPVVPIINKGEFSNIVIPLPPKDLQQKFADKIEAIERQKQLIKESIQETETLFNARMDYYFN